MNTKLLILDDDLSILEMLNAIFEDEGMEIILQSDCDSAIQCVREDHPNVAILDICLPKKSGLEVLQEIKKIDPGLSVIMTTGYRTTRNAIEAMKHGAYDYLTKPFEIDKIKSVVGKALECNLLNRKVRYAGTNEHIPTDELEEDIMIGSTPGMIQIWKMVGKVADSDTTVLIQGESGTGKELLARAVYNNSQRNNKPFLAVNCAALPENLLESELFGHEKGAFTDAHTRRIGKFEQCDGGTIFLDEIAEMSLWNQGKLLRVLENQEFERVGGNETIKVDVRVIAATNASLLSAVREKQFRMDLFYRLRVISFYLPPLRERLDDLPILVNLFIRKYAQKYNKTVNGISPAATELLMAQPWEGNIRELKNVINSSVLFCKGDILLPDDFESLQHTRGKTKKVNPEMVGSNYYEAFLSMLEPSFDEICDKYPGYVFENMTTDLEKAVIRMAMEKSGQNQVLAAKILGISRNTLRDRLEKYKFGTG
jgi:two-component system nitrogen regulation response regulator GlnG